MFAGVVLVKTVPSTTDQTVAGNNERELQEVNFRCNGGRDRRKGLSENGLP
jgi:hypothetical protein